MMKLPFLSYAGVRAKTCVNGNVETGQGAACHDINRLLAGTNYWLRVFPPPEFVWKPLWVCLSPVSGEFVRIRFLWRSIWREVSSGKGFQ